MIYFTADTHFGHENIIRHCQRPFETVAKMDDAMVERWNDVVGPDDTVYHLGDFAYRCDPGCALNIAARLNGHKHLVPGGHDHGKSCRMLNGAFDVLPPLVTLQGAGHPPIVLCHYPLLTWWNKGRGSIMLHGHCHGRVVGEVRRVDVGVDAWGFGPVSLDAVLKKACAQAAVQARTASDLLAACEKALEGRCGICISEHADMDCKNKAVMQQVRDAFEKARDRCAASRRTVLGR